MQVVCVGRVRVSGVHSSSLLSSRHQGRPGVDFVMPLLRNSASKGGRHCSLGCNADVDGDVKNRQRDRSVIFCQRGLTPSYPIAVFACGCTATVGLRVRRCLPAFFKGSPGIALAACSWDDHRTHKCIREARRRTQRSFHGHASVVACAPGSAGGCCPVVQASDGLRCLWNITANASGERPPVTCRSAAERAPQSVRRRASWCRRDLGLHQ